MKNKLLLITVSILLLLPNGCQAAPAQGRGQAETGSRTVRIDYADLTPLSDISTQEEMQYQVAGITRVGVSAGRVDWSFFPWPDHPSAWAAPVKESGVDFLARDAKRFSAWADVTVVVDVLAPVYIQAHPDAAAVSWGGKPSAELVNLTQMTSGNFSDDLLNFIAASSSLKQADSILLVELFYYVDGFGATDLATFRKDTGQTGWPRLESGEIDINSPLLSTWRTQRLIVFLSRAAALAHAKNKQLWLEVKPDERQLSLQDWTAYQAYLGVVDRLVVMGNPIFNDADAGRINLTIDNLNALGQGRILYEIGVWADDGHSQISESPISPEELKTLVQDAKSRGIKDFWFTPSYLMTPEYWAVLTTVGK
jgi:hypothetical protein